MARITPAFLRARFDRIMGEAGFDVTSPAYFKDEAGVNRATVGRVFLAKGAMGGWYAARHVNEGGGEGNLCGTWRTLTTSEMMAFLDAVEMMTRHKAT